MAAAAEAALLVTIGTSATTNLPWHVVELAARRGIPIIDLNPMENPFGELAATLPHGAVIRAPAAETLPALADAIAAACEIS